jgi:hypothetical protein
MSTNFLRSHLKSSHKDLFKKLEDADKKNKNFASVGVGQKFLANQ